jgi:hypothetical protein
MIDQTQPTEKPNASIKGYSITELAAFYSQSAKVMRNWLKPYKELIGQRQGHSYTPKQVKIIFTLIGLPPDFPDSCLDDV